MPRGVQFVQKVFRQKLLLSRLLPRLYSSQGTALAKAETHGEFIDFHNDWPSAERQKFIEDMRILPDFLAPDEEERLLEEIEPYLKRMRYEFDHWDDAIHGYRETERRNWYPHNKAVIQRVGDIAFNGQIMPFIHVLDLAEGGVIKPHVDSTRYCGSTIAGMSLLSDSVMRLRRVDETKYKQGRDDKDENGSGGDSDYRSQPLPTPGNTSEHNFYADILLKRRSLYIMSHSARYNFTHEILGNDESQFRNKQVNKGRRISIICRNEPDDDDA